MILHSPPTGEMTKNSFGFIVKSVVTDANLAVGNFLKNRAAAYLISIWAKWMPRQLRGPQPNGLYTSFCVSVSVLSGIQRLMSNLRRISSAHTNGPPVVTLTPLDSARSWGHGAGSKIACWQLPLQAHTCCRH